MREHILWVADSIFQERGADVSLDEIAADTGISAEQLRSYFSSVCAIRLALADGQPRSVAVPTTTP